MEFKPFDVSAKELIWDDPAACLERFGVGPPGPVDVIDSDITALTAVADKVLRVDGPEPYLVNLEPQSSHDSDLVVNLWFRQAALYRRHRLPVPTVLILLRRRRMPVPLLESLKSRCQTAGRRICTITGWSDCGRRIPRRT